MTSVLRDDRNVTEVLVILESKASGEAHALENAKQKGDL